MTGERSQDALYADAASEHGAAIARVARGYERDPEKRRDLNQEIHFQLWRSLASFDARCSLRTWVYRVAHHVAASHVLRESRKLSTLLSLEELEKFPDTDPTDRHLRPFPSRVDRGAPDPARDKAVGVTSEIRVPSTPVRLITLARLC